LDGGKSTGAGAQSLSLLRAGIALSENVALGYNDEVLSREFLLQLTHETSLDLLEGLLKLVWNVYNGSLASATTVNLLSGKDEQVTKRCLELSRGEFKVEEFLGNLGFELVGFLHYNKNKTINAQGEMTAGGKTTLARGETT
jgi:hypothetical protein